MILSCKDKKSSSNNRVSESINNEIPMINSAKLGIDTILLNNLTTKIEKQEYPNIHSLLIAKNGSLIYEKYFEGQDEIYGKDVGVVKHSDTTLHDLRSISKSVVSICIGIAIDKGLIKGVNQKISSFFPEISFHGDKSNWTIEHFLSMTTGLVWNEDMPYNNLENDEIQMTYSKNPIAFVLNKPLETNPGARFNNNGRTTQVLAEIIERTSNTSLDRFVNNHLFWMTVCCCPICLPCNQVDGGLLEYLKRWPLEKNRSYYPDHQT